MSRRNILDGASLSAFEQVKGSSAIEEGVHKIGRASCRERV